MSSPLTSIHLVVSHPAHAVTPTLQSINTQTERQFQVVLVDNASQEIDVPWTQDKGPEVMVLRNFRDQGFSRAHNQALTSLFTRWPQETWPDRYVMLISSRLMLAPSALATLVKTLQEDASLAAVSPKIRRAWLQAGEGDEPQLVDAEVIEQAGVSIQNKVEPIWCGRGEKDEGQYDAVPADLPGTWCLLIRASALMQAKLGEEWLDVNMSEKWAMTDLTWRLRILKMPTRVVPEALAWVQYPSQSSNSLLSKIRTWYGPASLYERKDRSAMCLLRWKNSSFGSFLRVFPMLVGRWIIRTLTLLLDPRVIPAVLRTWTMIPTAWHKRHFLQLAIRRGGG